MLLAMKDAGLKPDEARCGSIDGLIEFRNKNTHSLLQVVFNNLLGGCINDCKLELAKESVKRLDAVI